MNDRTDGNPASARTDRQVPKLGRDRTADANSGSSSEQAGDEKLSLVARAGFHSLPRETVEVVAYKLLEDDLVEDNLRGAARNLNHLMRTNKGIRNSLEPAPVGEFHTVLNDAGNLAKDVHERTYPKDGLPEIPPDPYGAHEKLGLPVPADEYVRVVGPLTNLLSADQQSNIIKDIHQLSNQDAKAASGVAMTEHIDDRSPNDWSSLINDAVETLKESAPHRTDRGQAAAEAIARAQVRGHLPENPSELDDIRRNHPELRAMLDERLDRIQADANYARAAHIGDLSPKDQAAFVHEAIEIFGKEGRSYTYRREAASRAIAKAQVDDQLLPEHRSQLDAMTHNRSELRNMLDESIDEIQESLISARAERIADLIANDGLNPKERSPLIDEAIEIFGREPLSDAYISEALAKAQVHGHLEPGHQSKLDNRPDLRESIDFFIDDIPPASNPGARSEARPISGNTKSAMKGLRERFEKTSNDTTSSEHQRVQKIASVARSAPNEVDRARVNLMNRNRNRAGHGL